MKGVATLLFCQLETTISTGISLIFILNTHEFEVMRP